MTFSATLPRKNLGTPFLACVLVTMMSIPWLRANLVIPDHARGVGRTFLHEFDALPLRRGDPLNHAVQSLYRRITQPPHKPPLTALYEKNF